MAPTPIIRSSRYQASRVTPLEITDRQSLAGQKLAEKPEASCVLPDGFGPNVADDVSGVNGMEQAGQNPKVGPVVFECELDLVAERIAWPVTSLSG